MAREIGATFFVDMAHIAGLVAAGLHPNPGAFGRLRDDDHAQDPARPRGGVVLCKEERAKKLDSAVFPGLQGARSMHVIAGKAVCFGEALQARVQDLRRPGHCQRQYAGRGADPRRLPAGLGGTDNHLILIDMTSKGLTGKIGEALARPRGITVNKNLIPFDTCKPMDPSGVRVGTPALTTRGMREDAIRQGRRLDDRPSWPPPTTRLSPSASAAKSKSSPATTRFRPAALGAGPLPQSRSYRLDPSSTGLEAIPEGNLTTNDDEKHEWKTIVLRFFLFVFFVVVSSIEIFRG